MNSSIYLSRLVLNPKIGKVRRDIGNPYEMHRTLLRAFEDPDQPGQASECAGRLLFRVEPQNGDYHPVVLVQAWKPSCWEAVHSVENHYFEQFPVQEKVFNPRFQRGQKLRFRIRVNPVRATKAVGQEGGSGGRGKRYPLLKEEDQREWLSTRFQQSGAMLLNALVRDEGKQIMFRGKGVKPMIFHSILVDGILCVDQTDAFIQTLRLGIGPAKGFGFGLLSVAAS